ncbi:uncharacterized protein BP01DRAFT_47233 [Aspergillus saccharolyticus JOP 1030-1]|uniref:Uncharacterized protein n=1 Tax=Aspergillus saccharolyticus JOP 1030-1 TaxID=1450539 RepID=A0A318ZD54_9EURO|nr:hypothetical protein BP01DRAFT_47233 [Aspergillus saccharolyticus JOP 1030-1]PYH45259.1 hypothetical protein BP01DRAFT_47233 [Aspergillus saccharolyticus JOP 1030-1]
MASITSARSNPDQSSDRMILAHFISLHGFCLVLPSVFPLEWLTRSRLHDAFRVQAVSVIDANPYLSPSCVVLLSPLVCTSTSLFPSFQNLLFSVGVCKHFD